MDTLHVVEHLPAEGPPELLFLLFHGAGAGPRDMDRVLQRLAAEYPRAALVSVAAPDAFDAIPGGGAGLQWFSVVGVDEQNRPARVAAAMPRFVGAVRSLQRHYNIAWPTTALVGFSQGAIMALEAVQAEAALAGRVIAFSGRHASLPTHAPQDTTLHLLHGLDDPVVPHVPMVEAARRLVQLGADITADVLPGIGHDLHPALIDKAMEHLHTFLPKRVWREALSEAPVQNRVASSRELGPGGKQG